MIDIIGHQAIVAASIERSIVMSTKDWIREGKNGIEIQIYASPRAKSNKIVGLHDHRLKVQVSSLPIDGQANEVLINFLAQILNIRVKNILITKGLSSRLKTLVILELPLEVVRNKLLNPQTVKQ
jgi:uncharacterized protein (TIGR00251 family)